MKQLLLVHDSQEDPAVRRNYLENVGFMVTLCASGNECMKMIEMNKPNVIVMDILLKGKNGFEVLREIRKHHPPEEIAVILCTAIYQKQIYRDEAMEAGAQAYLYKPLNLYELVKEIHAVTKDQGKAVPANG